MKLKKLISVLVSVATLTSLLATVASADATITWNEDEGYYIVENAETVTDRTPYIETSVKKLTGAEVVALKTSGANGTAATTLSGAKLKDTAYGDETKYSVFEVTSTFKNVGELAYGYDAGLNENVWVRIDGFDATMAVSNDLYDKTEANGKPIVNLGVEKAALPQNGKLWSFGHNSTKQTAGLTLDCGADGKFPLVEEPKEDAYVSADTTYAVKTYIVIQNAYFTEDIELSYSTADAAVRYYVGADPINVKVADRSASFTLAAPQAEEPDVPVTPEEPKTKTVGAKAKMNAPKRFADIQGVLVTATNKAGNAGKALVKKADIFGKVTELNAEVVMGLNINNVPADEELTGVTMAWAY